MTLVATLMPGSAAGMDNLANNLFYTHNTTAEFNEVVYYCGMVGIVASWAQNENTFGMKQRFFFGHDNDIQCLAVHPNRRFVATGQQTSTEGKPYVCVWDIGDYSPADVATINAAKPGLKAASIGSASDPVQLQRLELGREFRGVLACAFSGNQHGRVDAAEDQRGGELLIAVTGDNKHTVHIWRWMLAAETVASPDDKVQRAFFKALVIPSWHFGPEKKLQGLERENKHYCTPEHDPDGPKAHVPGAAPFAFLPAW